MHSVRIAAASELSSLRNAINTGALAESWAATSSDIEKLLAIAPKYGIQIKLPQT